MAQTPQFKTSSNAGNLYLIFLGSFLVLLGSAFTFFMWLSFQRANHTRTWDKTPCEITLSEINRRRLPGHNEEFRWSVEYRYHIDSKAYSGNKPTLRGSKWTKTLEKAEESQQEFSVGASTHCFVNPANSSEAILQHDSRGAGYSIWFPMIFAVGGGGMIAGAVRKWNKKPKKSTHSA